MFEPVFMRLALVASIATGVSLGVMGVYLVVRRVVFLGLVVANAATLGAALAQAAGSSDTLHLLFGNILAVQVSDVVGLTIIAATIGLVQLLFTRRFLLVTFDPEAARVAGVNTRLWSLALNLAIGVAAAAAVHAIGALSTFTLLTLPAMAALLVTSSVRATFATAAALSIVLPCLALALSFYLDLPAGPACVALLAVSVPIAAMSNLAAARGNSPRRPQTPPTEPWPGMPGP